MPTRGAISPPETREKKPIRAAAPPAAFPCAAIAREKLDAPIAERVDTVTNNTTAINTTET